MLLATCFDEAALGSIKQMEGKTVQLVVDATGAVTASETAVPSPTNGAVPKSGVYHSSPQPSIPPPPPRLSSTLPSLPSSLLASNETSHFKQRCVILAVSANSLLHYTILCLAAQVE